MDVGCETHLLAELAAALDRGESGKTILEIDSELTQSELHRLINLGAIGTEEDELGLEVRYVLQPAGVRVLLDVDVPNPIFDVTYLRDCQVKSDLGKLSKIEMLGALCYMGFRPVYSLTGDV